MGREWPPLPLARRFSSKKTKMVCYNGAMVPSHSFTKLEGETGWVCLRCTEVVLHYVAAVDKSGRPCHGRAMVTATRDEKMAATLRLRWIARNARNKEIGKHVLCMKMYDKKVCQCRFCGTVKTWGGKDGFVKRDCPHLKEGVTGVRTPRKRKSADGTWSTGATRVAKRPRVQSEHEMAQLCRRQLADDRLLLTSSGRPPD